MVGQKSAIYCWAGPGTKRIIELKYPHHQINTASLFGSYEKKQLMAAKERLQISDAFVSYSWGFSTETEQEDYRFTLSKLENFQELSIKTHAYLQGTNLVLADHSDTDYYCRDHQDQLIPYHRGRKLTCVNNPHFQAYFLAKLESLLTTAVDGVFLDNWHFGLFPIRVGKNRTTFFGCHCKYCQKLFKVQVGGEIPDWFETGPLLDEYCEFRCRSLTSLTQTVSRLIKSAGKSFTSNSFDPKFEPKLMFGVDLEAAKKHQDNLLFENHSLPSRSKNNNYLKDLVDHSDKPVFVVSYKQGIGREKQFLQRDFDSIYTESLELGYHPCYKASEYTQKNTWFNLDFNQLEPVKIVTLKKSSTSPKNSRLPFASAIGFYNDHYVNFLNKYFEDIRWRESFNWLFYRAVG